METIVVSSFFVVCVIYEWVSGNFRQGVLSKTDFKMAAICSVGISLIQRPLVMAFIFLVAGWVLAPYQGALSSFEQEHFAWCLLAFILLEEYFHGLGHWFAHSRTPKLPWLRPVQKIFKTAHRPHHLIGNDDEKARISVAQTFVEGWTYWFVMPNIWFSFIAFIIVNIIIRGA